ncbi:MAG: 1,2-phenylacetyl-CoA epoxidase subunit PaaD [Gammaproteobacteria bacterium]
MMTVAREVTLVPSARAARLTPLPEDQHQQIMAVLARVKDPELPMVSIEDLGILRGVGLSRSDSLEVRITPTYSGCPAVEAIRQDILAALNEAGFQNVSVVEQLHPAWTTDWMSEAGKRALEEHGIAAPLPATCAHPVPDHGLVCPLCKSKKTSLISEFGSTACKAMYKCTDCLEIFDYFKRF